MSLPGGVPTPSVQADAAGPAALPGKGNGELSSEVAAKTHGSTTESREVNSGQLEFSGEILEVGRP